MFAFYKFEKNGFTEGNKTNKVQVRINFLGSSKSCASLKANLIMSSPPFKTLARFLFFKAYSPCPLLCLCLLPLSHSNPMLPSSNKARILPFLIGSWLLVVTDTSLPPTPHPHLGSQCCLCLGNSSCHCLTVSTHLLRSKWDLFSAVFLDPYPTLHIELMSLLFLHCSLFSLSNVYILHLVNNLFMCPLHLFGCKSRLLRLKVRDDI